MMKNSLICFFLVLLTAFVGCKSPEPSTALTPTQLTVKRRAEFRRQLAAKPERAIKAGLTDEDPVIRVRSAYELYVCQGRAALPELEKMVADADEQLATVLLACGTDMLKTHQDKTLLVKLAESSPNKKVKLLAKRRSSPAGKLHRETIRLKDNKAFDHDIVKVATIPLPTEGLRFSLDEEDEGIEKEWFAESFADEKWASLKVGPWERQGFDYNGIAWYRIRFDMPEKPVCNAVELFCPSVDECAWVWLNGVYVGQHDIGPSGWNKPFWIDVTADIRWGASNLLVIRVEDSAFAGGILKPMALEVLK